MEAKKFHRMIEETRERLTNLQQQQEGTPDEDRLVKAARQITVQIEQSQLFAFQEVCRYARNGWISLHVFKAAMQGQSQVLCEIHLGMECNDVMVAAEEVEEFAPLVANLREHILSVRSRLEETLSVCDVGLVNLAFRSEKGYSYLHLAVCEEDNQHVLFLLRAGADVNVVNSGHVTPLMLAAFTGNLVAMRHVADFGADTSIHMDPVGTVLHLVCALPELNGEVVDLLLRTGADEGALNARGDTPLDVLNNMSSEKEGFGSLRFLLEKAPVRRRWLRRWGSIAMIRNRDIAEGGRGRVEEVGGKRRSERLPEGRAIGALKFLVCRAPDRVFYRVTSFL